jgi:hypothetical protein
MPTTCDIEVSSITAPSGDVPPGANGTINLITNKEEADAFVAKIQAQTFSILAPPGTRPIRLGGITKMAAIKTKLKAEKRLAKDKKAKEAEEKKAAVAACKLDAQDKKREKLILPTGARALKAAAKVESIHTQLVGVMSQGITTSSTKISGTHVPEKSKGVSGQGTLSSPLFASLAHLHPQKKVASPKKKMMINCSLQPSRGLSSSSGSYSTMDSVEYPDNVSATGGMFPAPPSPATGRRILALMKGGCWYGTLACGSSPHQGRGSQWSDTNKDDSLLAIGDDSSSSSSQSRLPPGGPVLKGGSISSASNSSSLEVYGDVSPWGHRGTKPGTNHGSGADASKEES